MDSTEPTQVFVRNDKGKVWGPLALPTVELLIDNNLITGKLQVSEDGVNFAFPGRFPGIRRVFPRELWGEVITPGNPEDDAPPPFAAPPQMVDDAAAAGGVPAAGPGAGAAPLAGPGAVAAAARAAAGGGPMAGPGTRQTVVRPGVPPPAQPHRPPPPPKPAAAPSASDSPVAFTAEALFSDAPSAPRPPQARPALTPPPAAPPPPIERAAPAPAPAVAQPKAAPPPVAEAGSQPPARGELATTSAIHLYYLVASGELTGLLTLDLGDRKIEVHFRKGNPEFIGSSHPEDSIAAYLLSKGLATPAQISQAEGALDRFGGELVGALFGLGILNPGTAFSSLAQRAGTLLARALHAEKGHFTYEAKELSGGKVMPLGNRWALLSEQVRKLPPSEMKRRLGAELALPVMKSGGRVPAANLRLTAQETRALGHIDGVRSLQQLIKDMPQDADHFIRVAFLLRELEIVSFAAVATRPDLEPPPAPEPAPEPEPEPEPEPVAVAPVAPAVAPAPFAAPKITAAPAAAGPPKVTPAAPKPAAPVAPAAPAAPAPPPVSPEVEIKQLQAVAEKLKTQNFFELLGLTDKADSGAVKVAYFKLAKLYHPDTVAPGAPPELGKLKEDIFGKIGDAYRTLGDDKSRAAYVEDLKAGGGGAEKVDIALIFAAEEKFQKGCILVKARKFPEAVKYLDEAIAGNNTEGEFFAWRGYARFFTIADKKAAQAEAMKDLNLCLKKNERCAQAHYFIGQMAKLCGDLPGAAKSFQKCLQLQPDHLDAQREVRMTQKK
ncbi:MAG: J domain-containing protein [Myxococcaceae bacterium]